MQDCTSGFARVWGHGRRVGRSRAPAPSGEAGGGHPPRKVPQGHAAPHVISPTSGDPKGPSCFPERTLATPLQAPITKGLSPGCRLPGVLQPGDWALWGLVFLSRLWSLDPEAVLQGWTWPGEWLPQRAPEGAVPAMPPCWPPVPPAQRVPVEQPEIPWGGAPSPLSTLVHSPAKLSLAFCPKRAVLVMGVSEPAGSPLTPPDGTAGSWSGPPGPRRGIWRHQWPLTL